MNHCENHRCYTPCTVYYNRNLHNNYYNTFYPHAHRRIPSLMFLLLSRGSWSVSTTWVRASLFLPLNHVLPVTQSVNWLVSHHSYQAYSLTILKLSAWRMKAIHTPCVMSRGIMSIRVNGSTSWSEKSLNTSSVGSRSLANLIASAKRRELEHRNFFCLPSVDTIYI